MLSQEKDNKITLYFVENIFSKIILYFSLCCLFFIITSFASFMFKINYIFMGSIILPVVHIFFIFLVFVENEIYFLDDKIVIYFSFFKWIKIKRNSFGLNDNQRPQIKTIKYWRETLCINIYDVNEYQSKNNCVITMFCSYTNSKQLISKFNYNVNLMIQRYTL